jgi:hypothetical protein
LRHHGETSIFTAHLNHALAKPIPSDPGIDQAWQVTDENVHVSTSSNPLITDIKNQTMMRLL